MSTITYTQWLNESLSRVRKRNVVRKKKKHLTPAATIAGKRNPLISKFVPRKKSSMVRATQGKKAHVRNIGNPSHNPLNATNKM